jgi:hypothetical protein
MSDKLKQIQRFVETLSGLVDKSADLQQRVKLQRPAKAPLRVHNYVLIYVF